MTTGAPARIAPTRVLYALAQTARVGWYLGQGWTARQLTPRIAPVGPVAELPPGAFPDTPTLLADLRALLREDWRNIDAGFYRLPHDLVMPPARALRDAARFFADLPAVNLRRRERAATEVRQQPAAAGGYPSYYLQNFHFQSDGYLSDRSAALYDHQVEVLFNGGADAMRRQALPPLYRRLRRTGPVRLLDVGCGTGRLLSFAADSYAGWGLTGVDLSAPYLAAASRLLARWRRVDLVQALAEALPFADASFDAVTAVFLFHELPRRVRGQVAASIARVLRPGGVLVLIDSLQRGDEPRYDALLDRFPTSFHEPYYADYVRQDLGRLFARHGLVLEDSRRAFVSKVMTLVKR